MKLETARFGIIEFAEEDILKFKQGLYGFAEEKEFALLETGNAPFFCLQSVQTPELGFIVAEPWAFYQDYEFDLAEQAQEKLKIEEQEDVMVLNIIVVPENPEEMTMNLRAPLIINKEARLGRQIILDDYDFPVKYKLFNGQSASA